MTKRINHFLNRLSSEKAVIEDMNIKLVEDANKILEEHYLLFTKEDYDSFSDLNYEYYYKFVKETLSNIFDDYLIIERGKYYTCCETNKVIHAHAHLIPKKYKINILKEINNLSLELVASGNIKNLLEKAIHITPYILVHDNNLEGSLFKIDEYNMSIIRHIITNATKHKE